MLVRNARLQISLLALCFVGGAKLGAEMDMPNRPWVSSGELPAFKGMAATSQGTQPFSKKDLVGKVWVADFIFTNCGDICPRMTRHMRQLQDKLPREVMLASFTIDPDHDTLDVLQAYARETEADPKRWFFIRIKQGQLKTLLKEGFARVTNDKATFEKNAADQQSHNSRFALIDAQGHVRAFYDGFGDQAIEHIAQAIGFLLNEKQAPVKANQGGPIYVAQ